jgi:Ala-tRNA(Pro) deacylase
MATAEQSDLRGIDAVTSYLEEHGVSHEVVQHEQTFSATAEARAAGIEPDHAAKTMVLRDNADYRLAVIPASERLDLHKVRELLDASRNLRLATEPEMEADFGAFEVGATPPVGPTLPATEVLDRKLMEHERILCTGGDHRHSVLIDPREIERITEARVADICDDGAR